MKITAFGAINLMLLLALSSAKDNVYILQDGTKCPPEGTATSDAGKALNLLKNRVDAPEDGKIDPEVSLTAMLAPGNDISRFDARKGARIIGFVVDVKPGGKAETCNCGAKKLIDMDTHIELGIADKVPTIQRVIVEVTPRLRKQMKDKGEDWSTPTLQKKIKGKWVEVTGWLMFDTMHVDGAENTNPGGDMNWRATCWEIHPITGLKVLAEPPDALAKLKPDALKALVSARAEHVGRDPKTKQAIDKRNKKLLSEFHKTELEEKEAEAKERRR
jgi:hypothetical protein